MGKNQGIDLGFNRKDRDRAIKKLRKHPKALESIVSNDGYVRPLFFAREPFCLSNNCNAFICFANGLWLFEGNGVLPKDPVIGGHSVLLAADYGTAEAQAFLVQCYLKGFFGFAENHSSAIGWLNRMISEHGEELANELVKTVSENHYSYWLKKSSDLLNERGQGTHIVWSE